MIKAERGEKRRCLTCSGAFFDFNRAPIVCPKCDAVFQVVELVHSAPRRAGGFPNGARWRSPPLEAAVQEIDSESEREESEEEGVAPAPSDDEIPEVGDEIPEIEDESPDADMIKELM
jgi:uncharacterized protein (TIGR02300 family)